MQKNVLIEEYLDKEVKDFSIEVIKSRALPSVIDGFKPSARKVIFTADQVIRSLPKKTAGFVGEVMSKGNYDKGDGSLPGIITGLVQDFAGARNVPFLEGVGEFGSRKVPDGDSAPRYTKVKLHKNFDRYFRDKELQIYTKQDNAYFDPDYFLPILPILLLNPIPKSPAVGFSCEFQPYNEKDIIKNIELHLDGKPMKTMKPYFKGHKGKVYKQDDRWIQEGIITRTGIKIKITELPVKISREKYIAHLEKLVDIGLIRDYIEKSGDHFEFVVSISREQSRIFDKEKDKNLLKIFGLQIFLNENMNAISEQDTLLEFDDPNEIIEYFVKHRLSILTKRKKFMIQKFKNNNLKIRDKLIFIDGVISSKISLRNLKSKADLNSRIKNTQINDPENVIGIPAYNLTFDEINRLKDEAKENKIRIAYYKKVTEKELFLEDLK